MPRDSIEMRMVEAFRVSPAQLVHETFFAGSPQKLNLTRQAPGTIIRIAEVPQDTPNDQLPTATLAYRWFVTGARDRRGVNLSTLSPQGEPGQIDDPGLNQSPFL